MNFPNYSSTYNNSNKNNLYYSLNLQQLSNKTNYPEKSQIQNINIYNTCPLKNYNNNRNDNINVINKAINELNSINDEDKPKKQKKKVNFSKKVDVLFVESYKEYNKIEEDDPHLNNIYGKEKESHKSGKNCDCTII